MPICSAASFGFRFSIDKYMWFYTTMSSITMRFYIVSVDRELTSVLTNRLYTI